MPQTTIQTTPSPDAILRIRPLTPADAQAVLEHFACLSPEDHYLRFGTHKDRDVERLPLLVRHLFRTATQRRQFLYGGWSANAEQLRVCLGLCVHDSARPSSLELHISALPEARGGLVPALSGWLIGELVRHGATEVVVTFLQGNGPVQRLVEQLGMCPATFDGVPFFRLPLDGHARVIETWLQKTDALLAAARQELCESAARL